MKEAAVAIFGTLFIGISSFVVIYGFKAIRDEFGLFAMVASMLMWVLSVVGVCGCMDD